MAPGSTKPLTERSTRKEYQDSSWGVKGGRRIRLTTLPPSVSRLSRESVGASTSHNPMGLHSLLQGQLLLFRKLGHFRTICYIWHVDWTEEIYNKMQIPRKAGAMVGKEFMWYCLPVLTPKCLYTELPLVIPSTILSPPITRCALENTVIGSEALLLKLSPLHRANVGLWKPQHTFERG
jgi:hypothetical protein